MSSFQPGRRLLDWPRDVTYVADSLGLGTFSVLGFSAGGPYALACAREVPDRLGAVVLVSALTSLDMPKSTAEMAPQAYFYLKTARISSALAELVMTFMRLGLRDDNSVHEVAFSAPDWVLQVEQRLSLSRTLKESCRSGVRGLAWDATLVTRDWGFSLDSISLPVHLWHGESDRNTPIAMATSLCRSIPRCISHFCPHEGHLSIMRGAFDDIARTLVEGGASRNDRVRGG